MRVNLGNRRRWASEWLVAWRFKPIAWMSWSISSDESPRFGLGCWCLRSCASINPTQVDLTHFATLAPNEEPLYATDFTLLDLQRRSAST
ncbi:MAG UNVERIFIED_CONTAM: hypothetical protein LVT10_11250 [Anaerolineae bacterium]